MKKVVSFTVLCCLFLTSSVSFGIGKIPWKEISVRMALVGSAIFISFDNIINSVHDRIESIEETSENRGVSENLVKRTKYNYESHNKIMSFINEQNMLYYMIGKTFVYATAFNIFYSAIKNK